MSDDEFDPAADPLVPLIDDEEEEDEDDLAAIDPLAPVKVKKVAADDDLHDDDTVSIDDIADEEDALEEDAYDDVDEM